MPTFLRRFAAVIAFVAVAGSHVPAIDRQAERTEPEAKAAFLQKIFAFISWPKGDRAAGQPLRIAFIGHSPVAREFTRLMNDHPVGNKPFEVHYETLESNLDDYQVVFLPLSSARRAQALAERTSSRPVLTVCESSGGCDKGIVLTLLVADDRIRYEVNLKRARKVGITFHSQILTYAARVCDGGAP
jgi:hypothetical protein